eukprot:4458320-Pleurochrysis_carterae.AAC.4
MQVIWQIKALGLLCCLVWSRPAVRASTWPKCLTAKRRRGTLASTAIAMRSFGEAAAQPRDAILKELGYSTHLTATNS